MKKHDPVFTLQLILTVVLVWALILSMQIIKLGNDILDMLIAQTRINQFQNKILLDLSRGYKAVMIHQAEMASAMGYSRETYVSAAAID